MSKLMMHGNGLHLTILTVNGYDSISPFFFYTKNRLRLKNYLTAFVSPSLFNDLAGTFCFEKEVVPHL